MRTTTGSRRGRSGGGAGREAARGAPPPGDPEQELGDPQSVARTICLQLLTSRARSRAELAAALGRRGVPDDAARVVLDRFTEVGLIDDAALADGLAGAQHRERGLARRAITVKLRRRGLADEVIDAAVAQIDSDDERRRATELVQRKLRALDGVAPEVARRRLVGLLARKGYSPGLAYTVVRAVLDDRDGGSEDFEDVVGEGDA